MICAIIINVKITFVGYYITKSNKIYSFKAILYLRNQASLIY